jgi:hypothetical protein
MQKYLVPVLGVIFGSVAGYVYWQQVGCSSGTCMITSKPLNSTIYGAVMGYLVFDLVYNLIKKR